MKKFECDLCSLLLSFLQVYIEDSLGERIWVDSPHCKTFVDNIQTAFNTKMPPKSMLLHGEVGRSGGDISAGKWMFEKHQQGLTNRCEQCVT